MPDLAAAELFRSGVHVMFPALRVVLRAACRIELYERPCPDQCSGLNTTASRYLALSLDPLHRNANAIDRREISRTDGGADGGPVRVRSITARRSTQGRSPELRATPLIGPAGVAALAVHIMNQHGTHRRDLQHRRWEQSVSSADVHSYPGQPTRHSAQMLNQHVQLRPARPLTQPFSEPAAAGCG